MCGKSLFMSKFKYVHGSKIRVGMMGALFSDVARVKREETQGHYGRTVARDESSQSTL